jgi:hypothetical protein
VNAITQFGFRNRRLKKGAGALVNHYFPSRNVRTGSAVHPPFTSIGTAVSFHRIKAAGREAGFSPPCSVEVMGASLAPLVLNACLACIV